VICAAFFINCAKLCIWVTKTNNKYHKEDKDMTQDLSTIYVALIASQSKTKRS